MENVIFGIDIMPYSSPSSKREPKYAMVILREGKIVNEYIDVPLRRLVRFTWEYRPRVIGLDNIFELGKSEREVARVLSLLPPETDIVQVTLTDEGPVDLKSIASKYGIEVYSKPDPLKTAYIIAYLVEKGAGISVKAVEEKTYIYVVRGRSLGKGGSSQDRYKRYSRGLILRVAKKIKDSLEKAGIDYEMNLRRSEGGLERCVFTVYAPREKLYGIVKQHKGKGVRVIIRPIYKSELTFKPIGRDETKVLRRLIVGIDPGMVTGVAAIDTHGNIHLLTSGRNLDRQEILSKLISVGKPIVIASDVNPPPETVVKLAQALQAELYVPPYTLSTAEKQGIIDRYIDKHVKINVEDTHQRDALSAALKALNYYQSKLRQAEAYLSKLDLDINVDDVREAIIRGKSIAEAIEDEIAKLLQVREEREVKKEIPKVQVVNVEKYLKKIRELEREIISLKEKNKSLKDEVKRLKEELREYRRHEDLETKTFRDLSTLSSEVKRLSDVIRSLEGELIQLRDKINQYREAILSIHKGGMKLARSLSSITMDNISKSIRTYGQLLENEVLYVDNLTFVQDDALKYLREKSILGIIVNEAVSELVEYIESEYQIPIVKKEQLKNVSSIDEYLLYGKDVEDTLLVRKEDLIRRYEESKKLDLDILLKEYREKRWSYKPFNG